MKSILIFGGTQYVGKRLLSLLIEKKYDITVATRGNFPIPLGDNIKTVKLDRYDARTFPKELDREWDIIIDQLAFCASDAKIIVDFFNKAKRLIVVSSSAIYESSKNCLESDFDPCSQETSLNVEAGCPKIIPDTPDYCLGKRDAEIIYSCHHENVSLVRFPKILGMDDLSNRLLEIILLVKNNKNIYVSSSEKEYSFIHSRDAARFMSWLVDNPIKGPINAASDGIENGRSLVEKLKGDTNQIKIDGENEHSLFKGKEIVLNCDLAKSLGFKFESNDLWIKEVSQLWNFYSQYFKENDN